MKGGCEHSSTIAECNVRVHALPSTIATNHQTHIQSDEIRTYMFFVRKVCQNTCAIRISGALPWQTTWFSTLHRIPHDEHLAHVRKLEITEKTCTTRGILHQMMPYLRCFGWGGMERDRGTEGPSLGDAICLRHSDCMVASLFPIVCFTVLT